MSALSFCSIFFSFYRESTVYREKLVRNLFLKKNKFAEEIAFLLTCLFAKLLRLVNISLLLQENVKVPGQKSAKHENFARTLPVIEGDGVTLGEAGPQLAQHLLVPVLTEPDHLIHNTCTRHMSHAYMINSNVFSTKRSPNAFLPIQVNR